MKLFLVITFIFLSLISLAQKATIKGSVTDAKTKEPLIGANVIHNQGGGAAVDYNGNYSLEVEPGKVLLSYKFIGYEMQEKIVTVKAGETLVLNIELSEGNQLNDVVISASKFEQKIGEVPVSMNVIKPELINNKAVTDAEVLVDQCPGVQVLENQVSIRGGSGFSYGSGSRVLLMVDGLPMLSADAGDIKWVALPLENMEQIEIIKGASSVLYGSSALNGVINIRTGFPRSEPKTVINFSNGIYLPRTGTQKGTSLIEGDSIIDRTRLNWNPNTNYYVTGNFYHSRKVKENLDLVIGGNFLTDEGYRLGEDEHRYRFNTNLRWRSKKIDGLSYGVNANHMGVKGGLFFLWENADSALLPQNLLDTNTTLQKYRNYRTNIDPFITYYTEKGDKHSLKTRIYNTSNNNTSGQSSIANLYYAEYQFQKRWRKEFTTTMGVMNNYSTIRAELYGNHFSNNTAAYFQGDKKWRKFTFSGGFRLEYFQMNENITEAEVRFVEETLPVKPVARFGSTYEISKYTFLRASFGQGYRFPTVAERFIATSVGGLNIFPNPNVRPETGYSTEVGIKQAFKIGGFQGYVDLAGFYTEYRDMMEFTFGFYELDGTPWDLNNPDGLTFNNFGAQSKNVEDAVIKGGEINIVGSGKIGQLDFTILAGYTYIDPRTANPEDSVYLATFSDSTTVLKYRSRHLAKADVQMDYKKLAFGFSTRYNSFMENVDQTFVSDFLGQLILPGYADYRAARRTGDIVVDARTSFAFTENSKISLIMNNVFNREYSTRPGNVMQPRTLIVQYSFNF